MASFLSPIASGEPSSASDGRSCHEAAQSRSPSTGSQVSELDEEDSTTTANDYRRTSGKLSGASLSSAGSIAHQFLLHHHRNSSASGNYDPNHQAAAAGHPYSNLYNLKQSKRFKQILQTIRLPLVATSIITVFILCLLLRECKSLQVAQGLQPLAMESPLVRTADEGADGDTSGGAASPFRPSVRLLRQHQHLARPEEAAEGGGQSAETAGNQQQQLELGRLELNREILRDLMQRHRQHQQPRDRQPQSKRHSGADLFGEHYRQQQEARLEETAVAGGDTPLPEQDGESEQQAAADRLVEAGESEMRAGPAHLRSSAFELELGDEQRPAKAAAHSAPLAAALSAAHRHRQHQPHQPHPQQHQQQYQQQQQQQQQQQHSFRQSEEHAKSQQQHPLINNHDRPFDVFQIQCNTTEEGFELFACPTADNLGRFRCIEDSLFCDGYYDCPGKEDEERVSCLYYKLTMDLKKSTHQHYKLKGATRILSADHSIEEPDKAPAEASVDSTTSSGITPFAPDSRLSQTLAGNASAAIFTDNAASSSSSAPTYGGQSGATADAIGQQQPSLQSPPTNLPYDIRSLFECPICFDYAVPPIYQCQNGHLVCQLCSGKITSCPTCRVPIAKPSIRNLQLDRLANTFQFPCKYNFNGCPWKSYWFKKRDHEESCDFISYSCPCPGTACKWTGLLSEVMPHLSGQHKSITTLRGEDIVFLATDIDLKGAVDWVMIQSCFDHHFLLVLEKQELKSGQQQFFAVVQLIGSQREAEKFKYKLELSSNVDGQVKRLQWEATPRSILDGTQIAISTHDCLVFDAKTAQHFLSPITKDRDQLQKGREHRGENLGINVTIDCLV